MQTSRIIEFCGLPTVAGLTWELPRVARQSLSSTEKLLQAFAPPPAARWSFGDRVAVSMDKACVGLPALSRTVLDVLPEDLRPLAVLVALSDQHSGVSTAFVLAAGKPILGVEPLFAGVDDLVKHVEAVIETGGINTLFLSGDVATTWRSEVRAEVPVVVFEPTEIDVAALPVAQTGRAPVRTLAVSVALLSTVAFLISTYGERVVAALHPAPVEVALNLPRVPELGSFAKGCTAAQDQDWPSVPGWSMLSAGCRLAGEGQPAGAWRQFALEGGRNPIIAQRVAEMVFADWPYGVTYTSVTIAAEVPFDLAWIDVAQESGTAAIAPAMGDGTAEGSLLRKAEDAFVGLEREIVSNLAMQDETVTVTSDAPIAEVLGRTDRLSATWIESVERNGSGTYLKLRSLPKLGLPIVQPAGMSAASPLPASLPVTQ